MAKEVIVRIVDDLTGVPVPEGTGETIRFGLAGTNYEIDLSSENAEEFHALLAKYTKAARKVEAGGTRRAVGKPTDKEQVAKVRRWAQEHGHAVSSRGRVPKSILDAYYAGH